MEEKKNGKKVILVFSDIDGTLIQKAKEGDNVEGLVPVSKTKYGCSYMTAEQIKNLQQLDNEIEIVLTTSRGLESYETIHFGFTPEHVLIESGSVLITEGKKDEQWDNQVKEDIMGEDFKLLQKIKEIVCSSGYSMKYEKNEYLLDFVDKEYLEEKNEDKKQTKFDTLQKKLLGDPEIGNKFICYSHNNGLTVVYKGLDKGEMIERYKQRIKKEYGISDEDLFTVSMGDSAADSTMFKITDYSFGTKGSGATFEYEISKTLESKLGFTDFIFKGLKELIKRIRNDEKTKNGDSVVNKYAPDDAEL